MNCTDLESFSILLKRCGELQDLEAAKKAHARLVSSCGANYGTYMGNLLIQMYGKCGSTLHAREVFNQVNKKNAYTWNLAIAAYAQNGHHTEALELFHHMDLESLIKPTHVTFLTLLGVCSLNKGRQLHERLVQYGLLDLQVSLGNALINLYCRFKQFGDAWNVLRGMPESDIISWTTFMEACDYFGEPNDVFHLFRSIQLEGVKPDSVTMVAVLSACSKAGNLNLGKWVHYQAAITGMDTEVFLMNSIINMYGKCKSIHLAKMVFEKLPRTNLVSWNSIITANTENGDLQGALDVYKKMCIQGVQANEITFVSLLSGCTGPQHLETGRLVHLEMEKRVRARSRTGSVFVETALLNMYGKCGSLEDAMGIFNRMHTRNLVSWNAMAVAYAQFGQYKEALKHYKKMDLEGIKPNELTYIGLVDACTSSGDLDEARKAHVRVSTEGFDGSDMLRTSMVNMYAKCGSLENARMVFESKMYMGMNVTSWSSIIAANAQYRDFDEVVKVFRTMLLYGVHPNDITCLSVFHACNHGGLLEEGLQVFASMEQDLRVSRTSKHFGCIVDLLSRAGRIEDAKELIQNIPVELDGACYMSLLGACNSTQNSLSVASHVVKMEQHAASAYVALSNTTKLCALNM